MAHGKSDLHSWAQKKGAFQLPSLSGCVFYFAPSSNKAMKPMKYIAAPTQNTNSAKALGAKNKPKRPTTNRTIPKQAKTTFLISFYIVRGESSPLWLLL